MLCWYTISEWGWECVAFPFAYKGWQYSRYVLFIWNRFSNTQIWPLQIVNALLMQIFGDTSDVIAVIFADKRSQ